MSLVYKVSLELHHRVMNEPAKKMALIDIEWTPGPHDNEYYPIEMAVIILQSNLDGWSELESYETLINPDVPLCPRITALTGITPVMLKDAPRLVDSIEHLNRLTQDCTMVAHGALKDQLVLESALSRIGYSMPRAWLCTLERAKKEWIDLDSYDLASLSAMTGYRARREHRAMEDTRALAHVFHRLVRAPRVWLEWKKNDLQDYLSHLKSKDFKKFEDIPERPGSFSFYENNKLLYLGEATHLRSEIQRLAPLALDYRIDQLTIEVNEHELVNIVTTTSLNARFNPMLNKVWEKKLLWGLYRYRDSRGFMQCKVRKIDGQKHLPLEAFASKEQGLLKLAALNKTVFENSRQQFKTPQEIELLNQKRQQLIDRLVLPFENAKITLKKNEDEWVLIERGRLARFKRKGKETPIRETLQMRYAFMRRLREIKTRPDHPYQFVTLKARPYLALPKAGRRSPEKTRTGTLEASAAIS